jgi:hypothetical protein
MRAQATEAMVFWQEAAACAGRPDLMDVDGDRPAEQTALALCARCPVLAECTNFAVHHDVAGVCGGLTRAERVAWQRDRGIAVATAGAFLPDDVAAIDELASSGYLERGHGTAANRARYVVMLANRGCAASEIAEMMQLTVRSVNRLLEIAVHNLGFTLDTTAVITVTTDPPRSIARRGLCGAEDETAA